MSSRNSSAQHGGREGSEPICVHSNSRVLISSSLVNIRFEAAWKKNSKNVTTTQIFLCIFCAQHSPIDMCMPPCSRFFIMNLLFPQGLLRYN